MGAKNEVPMENRRQKTENRSQKFGTIDPEIFYRYGDSPQSKILRDLRALRASHSVIAA
jgi:hypothetical protein